MTKNKQKQKQRKNNYKNKTNLNKIISVNLKCYKENKMRKYNQQWLSGVDLGWEDQAADGAFKLVRVG